MSQVRVRQADIARAVKAALRAGVALERVEIKFDGTISIFPVTNLGTKKDEPTSLDAWRAANGAR